MKLLSLQECARTYYKSPYIYEISNPKSSLLIFGSKHSSDPKDLQFSLLKKKFYEFKPEVVFVEGGFEKGTWFGKMKSENDCIAFGEMAFITYLAQKENIPVKSWDVSDKERISFLLKIFSKEEVFAFSILEVLPQYHRQGKDHRHIESEIINFKSNTHWKNFDYSLKNLKEIHLRILKKELSFENIDTRFYSFNPMTPKASILHNISEYDTINRDKTGAKIILKELSKKKRVLAVMGSTHAVVQEPAYRSFLQ